MKKDCELWIVGEGDLKDAMLQEINKYGIADSVKWLGRRNDVEQLMQGMDLLLQPSIFEGLGIVLVEAQAGGLQVLTSKDVVPNEANVTKAFNNERLDSAPNIWALRILDIISRKDDRNNLASSFPKQFDINYEASRMENIIKDC